MTEKEMADKRFEAGKARSNITPEEAKEISDYFAARAKERRERGEEPEPSPIWEAWLKEQMNNR